MSDQYVLTEEQAVELLAFFITAARCLLDEPADYGSMRLLDAAERLCSFAQDHVSPDAQHLFNLIIEESTKIQRYVNQREEFTVLMDSLCGTMAQYLVDHSNLRESR